MLLVPNQSRNARGVKVINQEKPAFWIQVSVPAGMVPVTVPLALANTIGSPPPSRVNTPYDIKMGTSICTVVTPKLPKPAFNPSAKPCCFFGKKKLIFDIDEAKLPPPIPDSSAIS